MAAGFSYREEPIEYAALVKTLGEKTKLVESALQAFVQNGSELISVCRTHVETGGVEFKSASHSLKGSAGLIKATKLYPLAIGLSDVAKSEKNDAKARNILLTAVEKEFELVKAFVRDIIPTIATSAPKDLCVDAPPPVDHDALAAAFPGIKTVAGILTQYISQATKVFSALSRRVQKREVAKARAAAESLMRSAKSIKATVLYPLCLACVESLNQEEDCDRLRVFLDAIAHEHEKIAAFAKYLEQSQSSGAGSSGAATSTEPPLVNYPALVKQFGGKREFVDTVLAQFIEFGKERVAKLRKAVEEDDKKLIWTEAHAMNGEVGMLQLHSMFDVCAKFLKVVTDNPEKTKIIKCVDAIDKEIQRIGVYIESQNKK